MYSIKLGDLLSITEGHCIPSEETKTYTRMWQSGKWPYSLDADIFLPPGTICMALGEDYYFDMLDIFFVEVLLENQELGLRHQVACIDASKVKRLGVNA